MKNKLPSFTTITLISAIGIHSLLITSAFAATDVCSSKNVAQEIKDAAGCTSSSNDLPRAIENILYSIIAVVGVVAVVYVIIGGINYMTSAGDTGKLEKAKKTILYALIGIIVCVLAFAIVNFTLGNIIQ